LTGLIFTIKLLLDIEKTRNQKTEKAGYLSTMQYRRFYTPGGTYFFTLVTYRRRNLFFNTQRKDLLLESINDVQKRHPFSLTAWVILPNHIHCIWTLPENDFDFSTRWRLIKSTFTRKFTDKPQEKLSVSRLKKGEQGVWQRRFWEHQIRDENDFKQHLDYIHYNPVKHRYVNSPINWPHSSFHKFVEENIYPPDWGTESEPLLQEQIGME